MATAYQKNRHPYLFILDDPEQAGYYFNDLENILGTQNVVYFPASFTQFYSEENTEKENVLTRSKVLSLLEKKEKPIIIVSHPKAVFEKIITQQSLQKNVIKIEKGTSIDFDFLNEFLFEINFQRVDFVSEPGEFAVRGGIIDIFSFAHAAPYRIVFLNDSIESIRTFDTNSQRSIDIVNEMTILGNTSVDFQKETRENFIATLSKNTILIFNNLNLVIDKIQLLFDEVTKKYKSIATHTILSAPEKLFINKKEFQKELSQKKCILLKKSTFLTPKKEMNFKQLPQPSFQRNFDLFINKLKQRNKKGEKTILFCANEQQAKRFQDIFEDLNPPVPYLSAVKTLSEGFEDEEIKCAFWTDHQIFERYHKYKLKSAYPKKQAIQIKELNRLEIGDYVTHIDHGIAQFGGLQKIEKEGKWQEVVKLIYAERDILYTSIHSLHKISKYNGKDGTTPKIYKLGTKTWKLLKQKTKKKIKEIAFNLIELYAKRKQKKGFACEPDSYLQHELEASFLYEDTPDQNKTTQKVKKDMENTQPMDRLICGDVGFGKTEIAIRAAFKAADNSRQTAILVPTTVLAFQHYRTFSKRMKNFPINIDYLNRFRSEKEKKQILENLKNGKIDIIIGTHILVHTKVTFKNLGLLIVDEEQKFGVAIKEKLKNLKNNIDVLTLSATPIPRTLQFSLMAARDLSMINSPPINRQPITNEIIHWNEKYIAEKILLELQRQGQIFFIHNSIQNIYEVANALQKMVPKAKIKVGHGKMKGKMLEQILLEFIQHKFDILISTTIAENGLDIPNANTIFINNAQNFGLSDLYQMRGRVGRSNKKAFCFFITPPLINLSEEAKKRITTIEKFSYLGAGMQIAIKDLEIRGAGDLLGAEQSGFINDIGWDTYQKLLANTIEELKEKEFKNLYEKEKTQPQTNNDFQFETDIEIGFPENYINLISERLFLYQKLNDCKNQKEIDDIEKEVIDRFGKLPPTAKTLLKTFQIKQVAKKIRIEKIVLKNNICNVYFDPPPNNPFFQSPIFNKILQHIQKNPKNFHLKETATKKGQRLAMKIIDATTMDAIFKNIKNIL